MNFLYGTAWKEEKTEALVKAAVTAGFRGIDTANQRRHYFEKAVGDALGALYQSGTVTRNDLFLQTKFTYLSSQDQRLPYDPKASFPEQVRQSFASSLEHLRTTYLDSYVLHGPLSHRGLQKADLEVWEAMEALQADGKTKTLGVSNVSLEQLQTLFDRARVKPSYVQNRCYAQTGWDWHVRNFCREHEIVYQGFSLLTANLDFIQSDPIRALAKRFQKTPSQIIFRFAQQVGMLPITGTSNPQHMAEDLKISDFELDPQAIATIEEIAVR